MKILVINIMPAIGELLFVTPVFKVIKQANPESSVDALIAANVQQVCLYNRYIDKIITFDKVEHQAGLIEHVRLIRKIRKTRYDLVINLNPSERSSLLAALSGGKKICGFATKSFKPFFKPFIIKDRTIHSADCYLKALVEIGIPNSIDNRLEMEYDQKSQTTADRFLFDNNLQNQIVVGIHPGANQRKKRWKPEYLAEFSDLLQKDGIKTIFFGGKADLEIVDQALSLCKVKPVLLTGKLNLLELAAITKKCSVFVSADSGPMHIAVSQQVPVVALFGPTNPVRYRPYNSPHILIQPDISNIPDNARIMDYISPGQVYQAVRSLLKN